jgi:hypothetical protein
MKSFVFILIGIIASFHLLAIDPVGKIAKANAAKERAEEAFYKGNFEKVVEHYSYLLDSLNYESPEAELNRAHAYFQLKDTVNAFDAYRRVSDVSNPQLKSKAMLQMGNLSEMQKEYKSALSFYKEALKADPTNNKARYNYELLKKKMQEQEKKDQENKEQQNKDQDQQDQDKKDQQSKENKDSENQEKEENQEKSQEEQKAEDQQKKDDAEKQDGKQNEQEKGKEQEQKEQQQKEGEEKKDGEEQEISPSTKQKLEDMNISEEKAKMILEALRNKESQYFQQLRKKATKKQDSGKPDW